LIWPLSAAQLAFTMPAKSTDPMASRVQKWRSVYFIILSYFVVLWCKKIRLNRTGLSTATGPSSDYGQYRRPITNEQSGG
jgi:hypothetical protein